MAHRSRKPSGKNKQNANPMTRSKTAERPNADISLDTWKKLASTAYKNSQWQEALKVVECGLEMSPDDAELHLAKAQALIKMGHRQEALGVLDKAVSLDRHLADIHYTLSYVLKIEGKFPSALKSIERALSLNPKAVEYTFHKSSILAELHRKDEALELLEQLTERYPSVSRYWNNAGILHRQLGNNKKAIECYQKAIEVDPENAQAYSNYITTMHYDPDQTRESIIQACADWGKKHSPLNCPERPVPDDKSPEKRLRVGLISDGFRTHPVGQMIISTLEKLPKHAFDLFAYSSSAISDRITDRFKKICHYEIVDHFRDHDLDARIRSDKIDILIDLAGYNTGSRMKVVAQEPAPVIVKWVGGLINTTGLNAIDYLITDNYESPVGDDQFYTENLIRMPNDYICYEMPGYSPHVSSLPAKKNGYITLGCFNNPMKLNAVLLEQWALIMKQLPGSILFLKGSEYNSEEFCQYIVDSMRKQGIERERLLLEGPDKHDKLLECYNRVDIALDPWPYSGGLSTCEAFAMGVPVITMPGPTFAGRHSATHLINAGMPELVTHSWDEYRARVLELASDLNSLATIRSHLRTVLMQSPVCDADTFAGHLNNVLRGIWQRYTEGKEPAAVYFTAQGEVIFEGDNSPSVLQHPPAPMSTNTTQFHWHFDGKIIAIEQGTLLLNTPMTKQMLDQGTLELFVFDPASNHTQHALRNHPACHYYPNIALGNGTPATLYACQSAQRTGTLAPLTDKNLPEKTRNELKLLTELPIGTVALDKANELPRLDWLVLDNLNDSQAVLNYGSESLQSTLLIHAQVAFQPTHAHQPTFSEMEHWTSRNGFRFYCFTDQDKRTPVPQSIVAADNYADELLSATALFIPSRQRILSLTDSQRMKLAYLLDGVYGLKGLCYELLRASNTALADAYITHNTNQLEAEKQPCTLKVDNRVISHIQNAPYINTSKDQKIKLVVGVPIYNEEPYIKETIESLLAQDADNVQYFISDNNSTDKTFEIVNDLIKSDSRFKTQQHKENIGAATNFIDIFKKTQSEYFIWIGGHDYISDRFIENAIKELDKHESTSMVTGQPMAILNNKKIGLVDNALYDFSDPNPLHRYMRSVASLSNCTIFHSMFRRAHLDNFDFRTTISGDHVIISHLLWFGKLFYMNDEYYFRRYFESRNSTQEERIIGREGKLQRADFIQHYLDDFSTLSRALPTDHANQYLEMMEKILKQRFTDPN